MVGGVSSDPSSIGSGVFTSFLEGLLYFNTHRNCFSLVRLVSDGKSYLIHITHRP